MDLTRFQHDAPGDVPYPPECSLPPQIRRARKMSARAMGVPDAYLPLSEFVETLRSSISPASSVGRAESEVGGVTTRDSGGGRGGVVGRGERREAGAVGSRVDPKPGPSSPTDWGLFLSPGWMDSGILAPSSPPAPVAVYSPWRLSPVACPHR
jgi:hypothetical protein